MKITKNRKAELTTKQLVTIIVLIVSFIIILFLIFRLDLGKTTEKEICHNSVVTRGSSVLPVEAVPLKCQRSYICITVDNTCETMTKPIKKKAKTQEEVYEILAEQLADCWWMFGEGEVNYVGKDMVGKLYCSICAQIAFDDSLNDIFPEGEIDKEAVYTYMQDNNYLKDETYLSYLYGINDLNGLKTELNNQNIEFGPINMAQQYYIMMGITSDVNTLGWAVAGAVVGAVALVAIPFSPIIGAGWGVGLGVAAIWGGGGAAAGAIGGGTVAGILINGASGNEYLSPSIIQVNSPEFEGLGCKSITTLS